MPAAAGEEGKVTRQTEILNARIKSTMLGFEDHGIFTSFVMVEWDGAGCGFGGFSFGSDKNSSGFGSAYTQRLLRVVGVEKWEDLKGQLVRVESEGLGGGIRRIGHIIKDQWFDPRELAKDFQDQPSIAAQRDGLLAALEAILPYANSRAEDMHATSPDADWQKANDAIVSAKLLIASVKGGA